jgi:G:T/U-mismatch repair DNA glycosylase
VLPVMRKDVRHTKGDLIVDEVNLKPYLRRGLDVLFVSLNPSTQSNGHGHYFSGTQSRFFCLLGRSGLTVSEADKACGDDVVFGGTTLNHGQAEFGVVDLVDDLVQTNSSMVRVDPRHIQILLDRIAEYEPRFVCVIHSKVRDRLNSSGRLAGQLDYGFCGELLPGCQSTWLLNYFPNGNNVPDDKKLAIYRELRDRL